MIIPMVVYVPLVMQNVAKYLTWLLSGTVNSSLNMIKNIMDENRTISVNVGTYRYPIPPTALAADMNKPRCWSRSEIYDVIVNMTAETAYGGTVRSCALAFAV